MQPWKASSPTSQKQYGQLSIITVKKINDIGEIRNRNKENRGEGEFNANLTRITYQKRQQTTNN
jgi:hypothetical protein